MTGAEILMGLQIAGSVIGAVGAISGGQNQSAIAEYNALLSERDAKAAKIAAADEEAKLHRQRAQVSSAQRVAAGKSGLVLEGSPIEVFGDTVYQAELDAQRIRYAGSVEEAKALGQAAGWRMQGRAAKTAGYIGAGSSLLTGLSGLKLPTKTETLGGGNSVNPRFGEAFGSI